MKPSTGLLLTLILCAASGARAADPLPVPSPTPNWPAARAPLAVVPVDFPEGFGRKRLYLDAGHGSPGNKGNRSVACEAEESYTLRVAQDLARRLEATGHFQVKLSRTPGQQPAYKARLEEAARWRADVLLSLHSDVRREVDEWRVPPGPDGCLRDDTSPGYSVLYADDIPEPLLSQRQVLARALAQRMGNAGFLPYGGQQYGGLYVSDPVQAGAFVSGRQPGRRIFVLREPTMPSAIIETHHALDFEEVARWDEARTLESFAAAVAQGLVDALTTPRHIPETTRVGPSLGGGVHTR